MVSGKQKHFYFTVILNKMSILHTSGNYLSVCIGSLRTMSHSEFTNTSQIHLTNTRKIQREIPLEPRFVVVRSTDFDF